MPTLQQALHTYLQVDRSPMTNRQYELVLSRLIVAIGPQRDVARVSYEDLLDYFDQLRSSGLKQITRAGYLQIIKTFFTWCVRRGYIAQSPASDIHIRSPEPDFTRIKAVPPDELARMVEFARVTSPRNYAIMLFLIDTGCRVGGLVSLTLTNLHLDEQWAMLVEKGRRPAKVLFGEMTTMALKRWLKLRPTAAHDYVWTGPGPDYAPLQRGGIAYITRTLAKNTGASRAWGPHSIRHSVGQAWAKGGVPLTITSRKLNHSDPSITARYYYPRDDTYLVQVSRDNELAPLRQNIPTKPLRIVKKDEDANAG